MRAAPSTSAGSSTDSDCRSLHRCILSSLARWNCSDRYRASCARSASSELRPERGREAQTHRLQKKLYYRSPGERMESKTKLLDHMRYVLRLKHMSLRTESIRQPYARS